MGFALHWRPASVAGVQALVEFIQRLVTAEAGPVRDQVVVQRSNKFRLVVVAMAAGSLN